MGRVRIIANDAEFPPALQASSGLIVVDYSATWCGPCQMIGPVFERLSDKYPSVTFLKVDVDVCKGVAQAMGVRSMPTFQFFVGGQKVEQFSGANAAQLEETIVRLSTSAGGAGAEGAAKGPASLNDLISKPSVHCLNESSAHTVNNVFSESEHYLESDCDEQLLISVGFNQNVKISAIRFIARKPEHGPKTVKLFVNPAAPIDFGNADSIPDVQTLTLTPADLTGNPVPLRFVKFQNVNSITLFVKDNQGGEETTMLNTLQFIGESKDTTNMSDFKRVAGEKGEVDH